MKRKFLAGRVASKNGQDFLIKEESGGIRLRGLIGVEIGQVVAVVGTEISHNLYKVDQQEIISADRLTEILKHRKLVAKFNRVPTSQRSGLLNSRQLPDNDFIFAFTVKQQSAQSEIHLDAKPRSAPRSVFEALSEASMTISDLKLIFPNDDVESIIVDLQCDGIAFELEGKICLL